MSERSERRAARYRLTRQLKDADAGAENSAEILKVWDDIAATHIHPVAAIRSEIEAADISPNHPYALRDDSSLLEMVLLLQAVRGVGGIHVN